MRPPAGGRRRRIVTADQTDEAAAVRRAAGRTDSRSRCLARFRAWPADLLLAQGLHSAHQALPRRLSLLHVRGSAARGQARLPLTRRGARHRARRRGRRLHRSAVHAGRQARAAIPGRARRVEGARPRHDDLLSDRDVRAGAARDRIAAACQSRRDDARGDRRPARGDGEPGHHAGVDQRAALRPWRRSLRFSRQTSRGQAGDACVWPAN